ncbi:hypothetical protein LZ31DRAFT_109448 [Colletotrichum somersetense]|nr:hypothetical protein LZ31DRAFT_109448 [Colletotrichum somersetense]
MHFKAESPLREHAIENAAAVTTTRYPTPTTEPYPKRQRLETPDPESAIRLDADGDLRLCVGAARVDKPSTFLVCSKALSLSSPVMKQIILDELAGLQSLQSGQSNRVIHLRNDLPGPMRLMLEIIHGDFQKVPQTMELFSTTTSRPLETSTIDQDGNSNIKSLMYFDKECNLFTEESTQLLPMSVVDRIAIKRAQLVPATVVPYVRLYNGLKRGNCECRFADRHARKTMSPRCRALAIGSLVHGFLDMEIEITTANPTFGYKGSLASLVDWIGKLEILMDHNWDAYNHDECARMQKVVKHKRMVSTPITPLTCIEPDYGTHIRSQAMKTGLTN